MDIYEDLFAMLPFPWWWLLVALAAVIVAAALWALVFGGRHRPEDLDNERDSSPRWAAAKDVSDLTGVGADPRRLRLGYLGRKEVRNPPMRSLMVVAPSGAGKTPRVVIPTVLGHAGPAVVESVKADVLLTTIDHRRSVGPVWIFDPADSAGRGSCRWSPLAGIESFGDAGRAARWLCESSKTDGQGLEGQQYWDTLGRRLLAPLLFLASRRGESMGMIGHWIQTEDEESVRALLEEIGDRPALDAWTAHCSTHEKTKSSVYGTAWSIMEAWAHPEIATAVDTRSADGGPVLNLAEFVAGDPNHPGTLYVVAPASEQELFTPVFETLTNAIVMEVERHAARSGVALDPPLLLMLDEAANIAPLRRLDQVASKSSGEGIVTVSVWQDEGQLEQIYGQARARTVSSNHYAHLFLPGINDHQTLRMVSDRIGQDTVSRLSTSLQRDGGASRTYASQEIDVAPPSWLRALPDGEAVVLTGRYKPMRLRVPGWWETHERDLIRPEVAARYDAMHTKKRKKKRPGHQLEGAGA